MKKTKHKKIVYIKFIIGIIIGITIGLGTSTIVYAAIQYNSSNVSYDNTTSGLTNTNVQDAIDELKTKAASCGTSSGGSNSGAGWWCSGVSGNPLSGKKVIALGERDGLPGQILSLLAESAGADVIYSVTHQQDYSVVSIPLDVQEIIKNYAEQYGADNIVVLLGNEDGEVAGIWAETVMSGDPTFAGPLAGVSLGLLAYHGIESDIKNYYDPDVYDEQASMLELILNVNDIEYEMSSARDTYCNSL